MRLPWVRSEEEREQAEEHVQEVTQHLRIALAELQRTLERIEHSTGRRA